MHRAIGSSIGLAYLPLAPLAASQSIAIDHDPVGCVQAGKFPQFFARFDPGGDVSRARLHFRPAGYPHWYSVPMQKEGLSVVGILPKPDKDLNRFEYDISATDASFNEARTQEYSPVVVSGPAACQQHKLMATALAKAKSVIVNPPEGIANAAKVPAGFSDNGVIAGASSTGGLSGLAIAGIAVAGAGAVAGGVVVATHKNAPPTTPSLTGTWVGPEVFTRRQRGALLGTEDLHYRQR